MNQAVQQLKRAQDDQRSKSLNQREQDISAREQLLSQAIAEFEGTTKVTAAKHEIKKAELAQLERDIVTQQEALARLATAHDDQLQANQESLQEITRQKATEQAALTSLTDQITRERQTLQAVKAEIKASKQYLVEQQELVDTTIAEWNTQLNEFHLEAQSIAEQKQAASEGVVRLQQQQTEFEDAVAQLQAKVTQLSATYEQKASQYRADLAQLREANEAEQALLVQNKQATANQLDAFAAREKAVQIKEVAIMKREMNLSAREQALISKSNLLDM